MSRARTWVVAAAALGLTLRLLFSLLYWTSQPLTRDEREYLSLARGLAAGRGFGYDTALLRDDPDPFGRAPGYPAFLALVGGGRDAGTHVPTAVKVAQSVAGAAGVILVGLLATRLAGPAAGRAAAFVAAVYPPLVWVAAYAYSEAIAWVLGLVVVWLLNRAAPPDRPASAGAAFACGLCAGALVLVRPAALAFVALAGAWLAIRRTPARAMALVAGAFVVVAPWTIRNAAVHGRFVPVATEGGVTFWTGNHPLAIGDGDLAANPGLKRASLELRASHPGLNEDQMEPVYYREAFSWIGAHPGRWLALEARKAFFFVVPAGPSYRLHSSRYDAASVISYGLVLPAGIIGVWRLGDRRRRAPGLWLLAASALTTSLLFFPQERFRIPVIDPTLMVCAGAAFMTARQSPREASPLHEGRRA